MTSAVAPDRAPSPSPRPSADHWGRSETARWLARMVFEPAYRYWFRAEIEGWERIPRDTGALLVANHAGAVPIDAAILMHGLEQLLDRPVYALHHHGLRATPFLGTFLARNGGVVAQRENANRLLQQEGALVLVFPEGTKGTTKPFNQRYHLQRFGRNGFVETAMRAGVPIVPIAVVGTEEAMPTVLRLPVRGTPEVWPVTLNVLLFGAAGTLLHFPTKVRARVLEPMRCSAPPGLDHYPLGDLAAVGEAIRDELQHAVDDLRQSRRSVWRG
jgi:1-acyl-sn-glycerol-3-phosphate acyltransferase